MTSERIFPSAPYFDLGSFHRAITTTSAEAQAWFDRGFTWCYAFNHEEAVICFHQALSWDPECVMAHWGIAYALGANYNKTWELYAAGEVDACLPKIKNALRNAEQHISKASPVEQALVNAITARLPSDLSTRDYAAWNESYCKAMAKVYKTYPEDIDIAAIYAESLMVLTPWKLWDLHTGKPAEGSRADEIQAVLEDVMRREEKVAIKHPGILHFYIHLMEMSAAPEKAIPASDHLIHLVPDAGHLNHMPSHIDILIGDYRRVIATNALGIVADQKYFALRGGNNFYAIYRLHNIGFLIYGAMFNGQFKMAMEYADVLEAQIPLDVLRPMAHFLESFYMVKPHVLVRFGRWEEIKVLPLPEDKGLFAITIATLHYAKGVAYAATGDICNAVEQRELYLAALANVTPTHMVFPNKAIDVLAVGTAMLDGEIEYRKGNYEVAFEHLRTSIHRSDTLNFGEPWGWMQPVRHAYAALKLEQGAVEEALNVYGADLGFNASLPRAHQHPNNVWALHGYHECLTRLGREAEAALLKPQLRVALAIAEVNISSSCFCRTEVDDGLLSRKSCC